MSYYEMQIAGCTRRLPLCEINEHLDIAAFIMFNDVEITEKAAAALLEKAPDFDALITAEAKGIPLCFEMARQSRRGYVVARKGEKLYMKNPLSAEVKSITTENKQRLYLGEDEAAFVRNKRLLIVDDVISTGESIRALEELALKAGAKIAGRAAVLAEGDAADRDDIVFLEKLPLFFK